MKKPFALYDDEFMLELLSEDQSAAEALEAMVDALGTEEVAPELSNKIMNALPADRFARFADDISAALDIDLAQAHKLLNGIDDDKNWEDSLLEGMKLYHVEGGPMVEKAITGFARLPPGGQFPLHKHLGEETIIVIQGYFKDSVSDKTFGPGDTIKMPTDSEHGFEVLDSGTQLTYLLVVQEGIEAHGMELKYDSPHM